MSAPTLDIDDRFAAQCSVVIDTNYGTCGTVTKSTIDYLSVSDLNALFQPGGKFADLDAWFHHSIEMKACGTRVYAWYDWIMANSDRSMYRESFKGALTGNKAVKGPSLMHPWIMGRQDSVVNRDHWRLENGITKASYTGDSPGTAIGTMTAGPLAAVGELDQTAVTALNPDSLTGYIIRVTSRHGMPMDPAWFKQRTVLHIFSKTSGVSEQGNWKVLASAVDTSLTYIDVLVISENAGSTAAFDSSPGGSAQKGVIIQGINNVNDFEKWCVNPVDINPRKMVPFWYQSRRYARCVDSEYEAVYKRLLASNAAFAEFQSIDMAERNRQQEHDEQVQFVNAFFFQKPISANQTLAAWESLADISSWTEVDLKPNLGGKVQAKRANFIGVKEQLYRCDRVKDLQGNPLNLLEFFDGIYDIIRARKSQNRKVTDIDVYTNTLYREAFRAAMIAYYKTFYGDILHFNVEVGKETNLGMIFDTYLHPRTGGVRINIISDEFFDDWRAEMASASIETVGNMLLILDIGKPGPNGGTIYYSMLTSNRKDYSTAAIEELARLDSGFQCVMETTSRRQMLNSETGTVVVECPKNSLWLENIGLGTPVSTGETGTTPYNFY